MADNLREHREGKGRHRHMERNEDKVPKKVSKEDVPTSEETTPSPGKERVLKGHTLPVSLAAAQRIQSTADKHPMDSILQDLKRDSLSSAEHSRHTHL